MAVKTSKDPKKATPGKAVAKKATAKKKAAAKKPVAKKKAAKKIVKKTAVKKTGLPKKTITKKAAKKSAVKKAAVRKPNAGKKKTSTAAVKKTAKKAVVPKAEPPKKAAGVARKTGVKKTIRPERAQKTLPANEKKHVIKRVKAKVIKPAAGMSQIIPIDALIEHAVKTEDPVRQFDKKYFKKVTAKVDPRHNMPISSKSKRANMPSLKKPLWKK